MPEIIRDTPLDDFKNMLANLEPNKVIILRFTAEWCGPCKGIDNICNNYFNVCNNNIIPVVVDVAEVITLSASSRTSPVREELRPVSLIFTTGFDIYVLL